MEAQRNNSEAEVDGKGFVNEVIFFVFVRLRKAECKETNIWELLCVFLSVNENNSTSYWGLNVHDYLVWAHTNHSENLAVVI